MEHTFTAQDLIACYRRGVFPMADSRHDEGVFLIDPQRRGVLPLDGLHISRRLGRTVRGLKVTADGIADYVERVVTRFLAERDAAAGETFAQWAHRADEEALR